MVGGRVGRPFAVHPRLDQEGVLAPVGEVGEGVGGVLEGGGRRHVPAADALGHRVGGRAGDGGPLERHGAVAGGGDLRLGLGGLRGRLHQVGVGEPRPLAVDAGLHQELVGPPVLQPLDRVGGGGAVVGVGLVGRAPLHGDGVFRGAGDLVPLERHGAVEGRGGRGLGLGGLRRGRYQIGVGKLRPFTAHVSLDQELVSVSILEAGNNIRSRLTAICISLVRRALLHGNRIFCSARNSIPLELHFPIACILNRWTRLGR